MTERVRIVIFEDLMVVREMLGDLFASDPANELVGAYADAETGLLRMGELAPAVAVVDYALPGMNGIELARKLRLASKGTKIVMLTAHDRPEILLAAVDAGIHGVVSKGSSVTILREAVAAVYAAGTYYCPKTAAALKADRASPTNRFPLSKREREVTRLIASGLSTKQVAFRLGLSEKTAANHRTNLMRKLGVHDVATLTRYAIEHGLAFDVPPRAKT